MKQTQPLMALCPIGKFVFSNEDAIRQKLAVQAILKEMSVPFIDLEGVLEDGLVKDQAHVDTVVEHFRRAKADCLFVPHCNFGTEGAVGMIASKLKLPTLLWGPRDEAPEADGTRLRDSLCGLLASSKVLVKLGVAFSYIENCRTDAPALREGIDRFRRAVAAAAPLRNGARIGLVGGRVDFFWTTIINESELLDRFNIEVVPFDMVEFIQAAQNRASAGRADYASQVAQLRQQCDVEGLDRDDELINVLAVRDQLLTLADDNGLDSMAMQSFMSIINECGAYCSYASAAVAETLPIAEESDIHGAISALMLRRAMLGEAPSYLAEFTTRHPDDDNAVLLWHASAPLSMCHPGIRPRIGHHWILPSDLSGMLHFVMKDGPITVARFDGDAGTYKLAAGQGHSADGPETLNNYVWMKVDDWPRWERQLIEGPFIHHCAMGYGLHAEALLEACRFVPGLQPVRLGKQ